MHDTVTDSRNSRHILDTAVFLIGKRFDQSGNRLRVSGHGDILLDFFLTRRGVGKSAVDAYTLAKTFAATV
jgi:hypothetical protein